MAFTHPLIDLAALALLVVAVPSLLFWATRRERRKGASQREAWRALAQRPGWRCPEPGQLEGNLPVPIEALHPMAQDCARSGRFPSMPAGHELARAADATLAQVHTLLAVMKQRAMAPMAWTYRHELDSESASACELHLQILGCPLLRLPHMVLVERSERARSRQPDVPPSPVGRALLAAIAIASESAPAFGTGAHALPDWPEVPLADSEFARRFAVLSPEAGRIAWLFDGDWCRRWMPLCEPGHALTPPASVHLRMEPGRVLLWVKDAGKDIRADDAEAVTSAVLELLTQQIERLREDPSHGW